MSPRALDRLGVVVIALAGALSGLIEALLVPLYAGRAVVPVAVLLALVGNLALPRMARSLVPSTAASLLPLGLWLAVLLLFLWGRPEGDVAFPSRPAGAEWTFYGVLFGGVIAGIVAVVTGQPAVTTGPDTKRTRPPARRVSR